MKLKSKLTDQDMSELIRIYDELKDLEPIASKTLKSFTVQDIIQLRTDIRAVIQMMEELLKDNGQDNKEDKPIKDAEGNTYIVCSSYTYFGKALKRLLSDSGEEEEDCSCDLVKELVDENEHLKNRVHNLNLYLAYTLECVPSRTYESLMNHFSGMPGYSAKEADDVNWPIFRDCFIDALEKLRKNGITTDYVLRFAPNMYDLSLEYKDELRELLEGKPAKVFKEYTSEYYTL